MIPGNLELVRSSWARLAHSRAIVADLFYQRLFELDPEVSRLFGGRDLAAQGASFHQTLDLIVQSLEEPERLVPILAGLGRRHAGYGVTSRHYDLVGDSLLAALRAALGQEWTTAHQAAWAEAYTLIASVMRRAGARASGEYTLPIGSGLPVPRPE